MLNTIVTGGSRGLGLGIARTLAASGFNVIAIARNTTAQLDDAIADASWRERGRLHFRAHDLSELPALPALVKQLRAEFGPLYGLVNNAGLGTGGVLATMQDDDIERLVRLNVLMPMMLTKYVVRSMLAAGAGRIVNVSSIVARTGYSGLSAYSATKASLEGFTRALAREVGPVGITVNAVAPGFVATEMTDGLSITDRDKIKRRSALGRMAEVEDVAAFVDYLFTEKACNITGTVMTVDAGNTA
ncbi:SDR family NAD(P)-dependent oxidoreductase [Lichenicoccus sp.]|uniref:SDR family NAD(P)-dependent oxidoreductase n=1 Tax=Lichenicoccus sp. TaxID=2781899 RepID=UPI003D0D1927